jgi:hypothetical protein
MLVLQKRGQRRCFTRSVIHLFSVFQCKKVGVDRRKRQMGTIEDAVIALTSSQFDVWKATELLQR